MTWIFQREIDRRDDRLRKKKMLTFSILDRFKVIFAATVGLCIYSIAILSVSGKELKKDPDSKFIHPGLLHSKDDIAFMRKQLAERHEPWSKAWSDLVEHEESSLAYKPSPLADVVRGPSNRPNIGSSDLTHDASAAYAHALQWVLTDQEEHAHKVIEILKAWSSTLKSIKGHDARLLVGLEMVKLCNAAELIKHSDARWAKVDQNEFEEMLRKILYPVIENFYPSANGNWDAAMIQSMIAMGIYLDDHVVFNRAVAYYTSGKGNGRVTHYINEIGQCQESGRDHLHVQMGLGYLGVACEMAWKQGVDLYGVADNRLALGFEYTAKYNLGEEVPFKDYISFEGRYKHYKMSRRGRGRFRPIYERVHNHYVNRKKMKLPWTKKVVEKEQPEEEHSQHISWGTLTAHGMPVEK